MNNQLEGSFEISDEEKVWWFLAGVCEYKWVTKELLEQSVWLDLPEDRVNRALGNLYCARLIDHKNTFVFGESEGYNIYRAKKGAEFPKEKFSKPE